MCQPSYSLDLVPAKFCSLPKTEDTDERKTVCYDREDKRKIETGAVGDTIRRVSEVFREMGKNAVISVSYLRGVTLKGTR